jgi:hypothetical protein
MDKRFKKVINSMSLIYKRLKVFLEKLHSGYCLAVWSVIYPHFLPFFLPESIGRARLIQHRNKSENGFVSVVALFSGFWIKIIRKNYF